MKLPLYFTPARLERLRHRLAHDAAFQARWQLVKDRAEEWVRVEWMAEKPAQNEGDLYKNFRAPARLLAEVVRNLALLHSIEPEERYAKKIRDGLLFYGDEYKDYAPWCSRPFRQRTPPWRSELVTGNLCLTYAVGLSVLRNWLPDHEHKRMVAALVSKGVIPLMQDWLWPETRIHSLDSHGHNWWIVCVSLAGVGALAVVDDHPDAMGWVKEIDRTMPQWFRYQGNLLDNKVPNLDSSGGYYESVHYGDYAVTEYLLYQTAHRDVLPGQAGKNEEILGKVADFFLHTIYPAQPQDLIVNFGDTRNNPPSTMSMRLLAENDIPCVGAQWVVNRAALTDTDPLGMVLESGSPGELPDHLPTSALYPGAGVAVLRSSWQENATLLAVRSGVYWIHAHADPGSFLLFHHGQPLISDPGHCDYANPEYADYYASSQAHNVVLVDGQGAHREDFARGSKFQGQVRSLLDHDGVKYVQADAAGPVAHLLKRHYRHWLWLDGAILIFDDLLAHRPSLFQWLLHYSGTAEWKAPCLNLRNGDAEATLEFLHPAGLEMRERPAPGQDSLETRTTYLEFSTTNRSQQQNFLSVLKPLPLGNGPVPTVEPFDLPDVLGARITTPEHSTDAYFNLLADGRLEGPNSHAVINGWETDAYLLAVTSNQSGTNHPLTDLRRLLVINGSYVRRDGIVLLDSLSSVDCLLVRRADKLILSIHGQPRIDLRLFSGPCPHQVEVNGSTASFEYDAPSQTVRIRISLDGQIHS